MPESDISIDIFFACPTCNRPEIAFAAMPCSVEPFASSEYGYHIFKKVQFSKFFKYSYCFFQPLGGFLQILLTRTNAQMLLKLLLLQSYVLLCLQPYVCSIVSSDNSAESLSMIRDFFTAKLIKILDNSHQHTASPTQLFKCRHQQPVFFRPNSRLAF